MRIVIETVPHADQPYKTAGMWWFDRDGADIHVQVSELGDWRYEALVGLHEATEAVLCKQAGVKEEDVTAFDVEFEGERARQACANERWTFRGETKEADAEPGDDSRAPYHRQHCFATAAERMLCAAMGVSWLEYERAVNELG